jgi:hypothetical protein
MRSDITSYCYHSGIKQREQNAIVEREIESQTHGLILVYPYVGLQVVRLPNQCLASENSFEASWLSLSLSPAHSTSASTALGPAFDSHHSFQISFSLCKLVESAVLCLVFKLKEWGKDLKDL